MLIGICSVSRLCLYKKKIWYFGEEKAEEMGEVSQQEETCHRKGMDVIAGQDEGMNKESRGEITRSGGEQGRQQKIWKDK